MEKFLEGKKKSVGAGEAGEIHVSAADYFLCERDQCLCWDIRGERRTHRSLLSIFSMFAAQNCFLFPIFSFTRVNG